MDALSVLLDESLPYGEALRRLAREGWSAGGGGHTPEEVAPAHDAPRELREWWLAPTGSGVMHAIAGGMPRIIGPEQWRTTYPLDFVLSMPDQAIGYWVLDPGHVVRWVPAPESRRVAITPLRTWLACFWILEVIQGSTEHRSEVLDDEALRETLAPLRPLPLEAWPWPAAPTRFYGAGDRFAVVFAAPEGGWEYWEGQREGTG